MAGQNQSALSEPDDRRPLVEVRNLAVRFVSREASVYAVNGVSLSIPAGQVLGIIGESGSGKSVTLRALMRLLPQQARISGEVRIGRYDMHRLNRRELCNVRGSTVSMIFQEPMTALDPVYTIGDQIAETVIRHEKCSKEAARQRALELLELVRVPLPERRYASYPHELSGGLRQRAMIALALSCRPDLLLADEPTTALDATVQIQTLILLRRLQIELGMAMIFVTHDLGAAAQVADKIAVMYGGRIVEYGNARDVLLRPSHPYTRGLLSSTVRAESRDCEIEIIPGNPPVLRELPSGCSFSPRCKLALNKCPLAIPEPISMGGEHVSYCFRAGTERSQ